MCTGVTLVFFLFRGLGVLCLLHSLRRNGGMFQLSNISGICITGLCCCERTEISLFTTRLFGVKTDEK